ncbi:MAG: hypothetical protein C5B47_05325 [Verrucomicrobia bacterium]|nr:MAG: hypothetical protein C5B47_05325 [Verrucomicrobiota bacterium]
MKEIVFAVLDFVLGWIAGSWFLGNLLLIGAFSFPLTLKGLQCGIFKNKFPLIAECFWMIVWTACLVGATIAAQRYFSNALHAYPLGIGLAFLFGVNRSDASEKNVAAYLRLYGRHMDVPRFERLRPVLLKLPIP